MEDSTSTLEVRGDLPVAAPRYLLGAGTALSHGAVRLCLIMAATENGNHVTLSQMMGVSARTVQGYMRELEQFGALQRIAGPPASYVLTFTDPRAVLR